MIVCLLVSNCLAMVEIDTPFRSRSFTWAWQSGVSADGRPRGLPTKSSEMPSESFPEIGRIGPRQNREVLMPYIAIKSVFYAKYDVASRTFVGTNPTSTTSNCASSKRTLRSRRPVSTCSESLISRTRSFRIRSAFFPPKSRPKSSPKIGRRQIDNTNSVSKGYRKSYGGLRTFASLEPILQG